MSRKAANVLLGLLALGVLLHAGHALLGPHSAPYDDLSDKWLYSILEFGAAGLLLARAITERDQRWAWAAIGTGMLLWSIGDLLWTLWLDDVETPPYPSVADAVYFGSYAALYAGLLALGRTSTSGWRDSIDGLIAGLTIAAIGAALIFPAVLSATEGSPTTVAVTLAYPLADLLLLCLVVVAVSLNRWRLNGMWALLGLGLASTAVADVIYNYQSSIGTYVPGSILDSLWPFAVLCAAAAAWQQPRPAPAQSRSHREAWIPGICAIGALALLFYSGLYAVSPLAVALSAAALSLGVLRTTLLMAENQRLLREATRESITDGLTGLANRRALVRDLDEVFTSPRTQTLALFDLDGFKSYNDLFGHAAGDELLAGLAERLARALDGEAKAYRLGGDEFCLLIPREAEPEDALLEVAVDALSAVGEQFTVTTSFGSVVMPRDAQSPRDALMLADARMYSNKNSRRGSGRGQVREVLLQVLSESVPELHLQLSDVADLVATVSRNLGLPLEQIDVAVRAAELHDVGKVAIPDSILHKSGPLDPEERAFMHKHTLIGERIVAASSALRPVARVVRSTRERWDGTGYPDQLAGDEIPLEARIVFVCAAYGAMTTRRAYGRVWSPREALAELHRNAGSQFDPRVVAALAEALQRGTASLSPAPYDGVVGGASSRTASTPR